MRWSSRPSHRPGPAAGCGWRPCWTAATTRPASRSARSGWRACRWNGTPRTAPGTTPSTPGAFPAPQTRRLPANPAAPAQRRQATLAKLADPRLTGMTAAQLEQLAAALAPAQAARAQQRYSQQRGGRARRATGNVRVRPLSGDAARLLLTLLYQRQVCSMNVLADLLEVTATCIGDLVKETREI